MAQEVHHTAHHFLIRLKRQVLLFLKKKRPSLTEFFAEKFSYRTAIKFSAFESYNERNSNDTLLRDAASCSNNGFLLAGTNFYREPQFLFNFHFICLFFFPGESLSSVCRWNRQVASVFRLQNNITLYNSAFPNATIPNRR